MNFFLEFQESLFDDLNTPKSLEYSERTYK